MGLSWINANGNASRTPKPPAIGVDAKTRPFIARSFQFCSMSRSICKVRVRKILSSRWSLRVEKQDSSHLLTNPPFWPPQHAPFAAFAHVYAALDHLFAAAPFSTPSVRTIMVPSQKDRILRPCRERAMKGQVPGPSGRLRAGLTWGSILYTYYIYNHIIYIYI